MIEAELLTPFESSSRLSTFSHIYVEENAKYYADTETVLRAFPHAKLIQIHDYKEIFNRARQNWKLQREGRKLILALKKEGFLYEGSAIAANNGHKTFYYNSLVQNCLFDCHYCYLQGMYPSANIVMYMNSDDFFAHTERKLKECGSVYLCLSYDTDLLAFEHIIPHCKRWIDFAAKHARLSIEIRTKSGNYSSIKSCPPLPNVTLAWTVSPKEVASLYESITPSPTVRLNAALAALRDGWQVRLCFDPILRVPGWKEIYSRFIDEVFARKEMGGVADVTLGVFRMNKDFFKRLKRRRLDSTLVHEKFETRDEIVSYSLEYEHEIVEFLRRSLRKYIDEGRILSLS